MRIIINRFEDEFAVVETVERKMVNMPKILLPKYAKEGDVIEIIINEQTTVSVL